MIKYTPCKYWEAIKAIGDGKKAEVLFEQHTKQDFWSDVVNCTINPKTADKYRFRIVEDVTMRPEAPVGFIYDATEMMFYYRGNRISRGNERIAFFKTELANELMLGNIIVPNENGKVRIEYELNCVPRE